MACHEIKAKRARTRKDEEEAICFWTVRFRFSSVAACGWWFEDAGDECFYSLQQVV
jgi:hypothetical protein